MTAAPNQSALDRLLACATRVRIVDGGVVGGQAIGTDILLDTSAPADLEALRACLRIVEGDDAFHCMCYGSFALELYEGAARPASTLVEISRLANDDYLLEIEAIAYLPE